MVNTVDKIIIVICLDYIDLDDKGFRLKKGLNEKPNCYKEEIGVHYISIHKIWFNILKNIISIIFHTTYYLLVSHMNCVKVSFWVLFYF